MVDEQKKKLIESEVTIFGQSAECVANCLAKSQKDSLLKQFA